MRGYAGAARLPAFPAKRASAPRWNGLGPGSLHRTRAGPRRAARLESWRAVTAVPPGRRAGPTPRPLRGDLTRTARAELATFAAAWPRGSVRCGRAALARWFATVYPAPVAPARATARVRVQRYAALSTGCSLRAGSSAAPPTVAARRCLDVARRDPRSGGTPAGAARWGLTVDRFHETLLRSPAALHRSPPSAQTSGLSGVHSDLALARGGAGRLTSWEAFVDRHWRDYPASRASPAMPTQRVPTPLADLFRAARRGARGRLRLLSTPHRPRRGCAPPVAAALDRSRDRA